jgi:hypothetical protein
MDAEYSALSMVMRDALPLKILSTDISTNVGLTQDTITHFQKTVWDDNDGILKLATLEPGRMTPRSKLYGIKYHWFRSKIKPNTIDIIKIASVDQRAEFLMKLLRREKFEANRKLTVGW